MQATVNPLLTNIFSDGSLVPLAVALVAVFLLMSSLRRRQQKPSQPPSGPQRHPPAQRQQLHRDLDDLMVELQELSRRISAEIDTRFAKLEAAMRDADRRIAVLSRLSRHAADSRANDAVSAVNGDNRHTVIYELADAGFSPVEIARDLGRTPGEVELILNLRKQTAEPRP